MAINQENMVQLQQIKFNLFKSQNPQIGRFDVTFDVGGKLLYAHKTKLNLVSDTFDSMLSDRWNSNKDEPIKIEGYGYDDFYQFITFLYSGQCELTEANIYAMVDIAEFYGVDLFKKYCEKYLSNMEITTDNFFKLLDLAGKYSMVQLVNSAYGFILNNFQSFIQCDGYFTASKAVIEDIVLALKDKIKPEDLFLAIYKWAEKQAISKQNGDPNLNLNDAIKSKIGAFLPNIYFDKMEHKFLLEFLVPRGFILTYNELSKVLCDSHSKRSSYDESLKTKVKITNSLGQTLHGNLIPNTTVIHDIESLKELPCERGYDTFCYWATGCNIPSTPSPLKERGGIPWYLIYYPDGDIGVTRSSIDRHYLLAELVPGPSGFFSAIGCKIEICK